MQRNLTARTYGVLFGLLCLLIPVSAAAQTAGELLDAAGVPGGLVVQVGCGDGHLTAALHVNDSYLIHGLDTDPSTVAKAREHVRSLGLYGPVSIDQFDGRHLPYADNLVNLVVSDDLGRVAMAEMMRVLRPNGVAYVKRDGDWSKSIKPWPDDIDEWTHFLHDASNNAVAQDTQVGPPRHMKWKCGPLWSRSHEFVSSMNAMVTTAGRMFYVVDEGITSVTDERIPQRWTLVARDAFNGVLLWKRPLPNWRGDSWTNSSMRSRPASVPRRIVGDGERLLATLSQRGPLEIIDGATGKTLQTIAGSENTREVLLSGRTILLRTAEVAARRSPSRGSILAVNADSGEKLWSAQADQYLLQSLCAADGRVVYCDGARTVCLDLADGSERWRQPAPGGQEKRSADATFILHGDLVIEGDGSKALARDADTGKILWTTASRGKSMRAGDLFVAGGRVWHNSDGGITGTDLLTGEPATVLDPSSVQSPGHHLRCYRAKATERFLITQFRGAEFISINDENHVNNDWIRGACRYGVMPSNGLLYVPPTPCFCYPGVKLNGLLALAPASATKTPVIESSQRLHPGPAYKPSVHHSSFSIHHSEAWPTYRHDARRSGATTSNVPADVSTQWQVQLGEPLTPPVACDGRAYVAAKNEHTLYALDLEDGSRLWHFTAGGRIDSPPTVHAGSVLFGSADGSVYCLRATDGQLAWRFQAAPCDRRIIAFSQLESPWRVHGSVLVTDGVAYVTAGRSTFIDDGIWIFGLDPTTGEILHQTHLDTWSPTRDDAEGKPYIPSYHIDGTHSDILVSQGDLIFLGQYTFDLELNQIDTPYNLLDPENPVTAMDITQEGFTEADADTVLGFEHFRSFHRYMEKAHPDVAEQYKQEFGDMNMGDRRTGMHLAPTAGFLDDTWFNRTFWMYSANWPGWYHGHRGAKSGQLLVVGPEKTYALQAYPTRNRQSPLFTPGDKGYLLLADDNDTEPILDDMTRGATKGMGYTRQVPPVWYDWVPIRIRGMVLAQKHLFVAGPPDTVDPADPMASFEGRQGAIIRVCSTDDGKMLAEHAIDAPPVFDGLIAAEGRLIICTTDGQITCLGENR